MSENKKYTSEFREQAVKLAVESDNPVSQTARELGVKESTLYTWIGKYHHPAPKNKSGAADEHIYDELKRLRKEIRHLKEERDILNAAAAN